MDHEFTLSIPLSGLKMKKFVFLFLTFSGICMATAQKPFSSDSLRKPTTSDSLPGKEKPLIRLYPNPAVNKVEIEIKDFDPGFVRVQIISNTGNILRDDQRLVFSGNEIIILMFSIEPGLYFLTVKQNKKQARAKLVVQ